MSLSKDEKFDKGQKMVIILILLDIIEMYSIDALPGTTFELKQAIKKAVTANKHMTKISSKYLSIAEEQVDTVTTDFGKAADFIKDFIDAYYNHQIMIEDGYYKIKVSDED